MRFADQAPLVPPEVGLFVALLDAGDVIDENGALTAADALCLPLVGLLGSAAYYARFGFVSAADVGIEPRDPAWGDQFQVRLLRGYQPCISGRFRYAPAFDGL